MRASYQSGIHVWNYCACLSSFCVCGLNLDMRASTACCLGGRSVRAMFLRIVSGS